MNRITTVLHSIVIALVVLSASTAASAQVAGRVQADKFKKEAGVVGIAIDDVVNAAVPGYGLLQRTKSAYLEGYGAVFTLEVAFAPPRSPFNSSKSPAEIRTLVTQRRKEMQVRLVALIQQKASTIGSLLPEESMAIVVYLVNSNPADLPDLPASIVISVKKQDVLDMETSAITAAELANRVSMREF